MVQKPNHFYTIFKTIKTFVEAIIAGNHDKKMAFYRLVCKPTLYQSTGYGIFREIEGLQTARYVGQKTEICRFFVDRGVRDPGVHYIEIPDSNRPRCVYV